VLLLAGLACLYWSKSKAGWLIAVVLAGICVLRLPLPRRFKVAVVAAGCLLGVGGFVWRFAAYFEGGAASAGATTIGKRRRTASAIPCWAPVRVRSLPVTARFKPPRLSRPCWRIMITCSRPPTPDSRRTAILTFVAGSLAVLRQARAGGCSAVCPVAWAAGLGTPGGVEFGLYVPAVGWGAFWLLGYLWGTAPAPPEKVGHHNRGVPLAERGGR
jgi:hypothetical protein